MPNGKDEIGGEGRHTMEEEKKYLLTSEGLKKFEEELHDLKVNKRYLKLRRS